LLNDYGHPAGVYYASGAFYFQESLSRFSLGQKVEAELVPEPCNRWDARAVAFDVEAQRVGYLPSTAAKMWHDVVRAWNVAGFAVYVTAEVNCWETDGGTRFGLTVPKWDWDMLVALAEAAGLRTAWSGVMEALSDKQRLLMRQDGGYTPDESVLRVLRRRHQQYPMFRWGVSADGGLGEQMPFWYGCFVREQMRQEQEQIRWARSVKASVRRAFKDEIGRRKKQQREQERLLRQGREEQALRLHGEGVANRDIATRIGLTSPQVEGLLYRARKAAGVASRHHENLQIERRLAAAEALRHKRAGLTRAEIARVMGRSLDSVKDLLQDAFFYECPEDYPERLALARQCVGLRGAGLTKDQVVKKLGGTRALALRAFRDASFLEDAAPPGPVAVRP
jgi:DNA-binding CsgD family transcriptional regulator